MSVQAVTVDKPRTQERTKTRVGKATPWKVIIFDDPVNLMEHVTRVLQKVFGYSREKAEQLMLQVHDSRKAIVWSGAKEKAELYVQQLHGFQLHAGLEKDE